MMFAMVQYVPIVMNEAQKRMHSLASRSSKRQKELNRKMPRVTVSGSNAPERLATARTQIQ